VAANQPLSDHLRAATADRSSSGMTRKDAALDWTEWRAFSSFAQTRQAKADLGPLVRLELARRRHASEPARYRR